MKDWIRKAGIAALAAATLAGATVTTTVPASAQRFHGGGWHGGGWHGGWGGGFHRGWGWGPAIAGGIALGALATSPYWGYDYGYGCGPVRRVVGYTPWGRPIVRVVDNCW